tara:strand:- start:442 stop:1110 length:669 start_codon:yes stop_codon:yes gene_type:complete
MFSKVRISVLVALLFVLCGGCTRLGEQPRYAFARFKKAVDEADGVAVGQEVAKESVAYLKQLDSWVLRGKAEQVEGLPLFDRFLVLRVRMTQADWDEAEWMRYAESVSQREERAIGEAWVPLIQNHFLNFQLGKIKFHEGIAGGPLLLGTKEVDTRIRFSKEDVWKIDLIGFLRDEFDALMVDYMGDDYQNRNRVDAYLKAEFGESFRKDLYRERVGVLIED